MATGGDGPLVALLKTIQVMHHDTPLNAFETRLPELPSHAQCPIRAPVFTDQERTYQPNSGVRCIVRDMRGA